MCIVVDPSRSPPASTPTLGRAASGILPHSRTELSHPTPTTGQKSADQDPPVHGDARGRTDEHGIEVELGYLRVAGHQITGGYDHGRHGPQVHRRAAAQPGEDSRAAQRP